jgi:hypothetical protein
MSSEDNERDSSPPSEIWSQLDLDTRATVISLLARMAYKYVTAQGELSDCVEQDQPPTDNLQG